MRVIKDLKKMYKGMSKYNRRRLIQANRPCGKKQRGRHVCSTKK